MCGRQEGTCTTQQLSKLLDLQTQAMQACTSYAFGLLTCSNTTRTSLGTPGFPSCLLKHYQDITGHRTSLGTGHHWAQDITGHRTSLGTGHHWAPQGSHHVSSNADAAAFQAAYALNAVQAKTCITRMLVKMECSDLSSGCGGGGGVHAGVSVRVLESDLTKTAPA